MCKQKCEQTCQTCLGVPTLSMEPEWELYHKDQKYAIIPVEQYNKIAKYLKRQKRKEQH